jgi:hypothetical protein
MDIREGTEPMMKTSTFGKTGMQVSALGLGGHELDWCSEQQADQLIHKALDQGFNVIDTAECYGESEERIGRALGARRQDCYLFTKCGHNDGFALPAWSPQLIEQNIDSSLRNLRTDYLDLVLLHSCSLKHLQQGDVITSLQQAQKAGKVRFIGYSGDRAAARFAANCGVFDALEFSVNIADQEAIDRLLPLATAHGMGIIAKRTLANLAWLPRKIPAAAATDVQVYKERLQTLHYDFLQNNNPDAVAIALRFTTSITGIHIAIVGTTNLDHIDHNASILTSGPLPQDQFDAIRTRWRAVVRWKKLLPGGRLSWQGWI